MRRIISPTPAFIAALFVFGAGCDDTSVTPDAGSEVGPPDAASAPALGARQTLRWRRVGALVRDLGRALELPLDAVCTEANGAPCAIARPIGVVDFLVAARGLDREAATAECARLQQAETCDDGVFMSESSHQGVHVVALGGQQPFLGNTYAPMDAPGVTSPLAIDRVALMACGERVRRDAEGPPRVFTALDLDLPAVGPETPGLRADTEALFRRLLARDPTAEEVDAAVEWTAAEPRPDGRSAARLICFAIATTTEVLFQ